MEISSNNSSGQQRTVQHTIISVDADIACRVFDILFDQIEKCIYQDRSRVKINMLTKGMISRMLGNDTRNGVKEYIANMYDNEIKELLTDIQKELNRRKL